MRTVAESAGAVRSALTRMGGDHVIDQFATGVAGVRHDDRIRISRGVVERERRNDLQYYVKPSAPRWRINGISIDAACWQPGHAPYSPSRSGTVSAARRSIARGFGSDRNRSTIVEIVSIG